MRAATSTWSRLMDAVARGAAIARSTSGVEDGVLGLRVRDIRCSRRNADTPAIWARSTSGFTVPTPSATTPILFDVRQQLPVLVSQRLHRGHGTPPRSAQA